MELFSLNALIDDIMLTARNNAISQSEDLSRAQVESWIHYYRAMLIRQLIDKGYDVDHGFLQQIDNIELQKEPINTIDTLPSSTDSPNDYTYRTIQKIPKPVNLANYNNGIFSVTDLHNQSMQEMSEQRRFYHRYVKYTKDEYTYHYEKPYIYIYGPDALRYIRITGLFENPIDAGLDPDDVYPMPTNMIPTLKQLIFQNELKFMLSSPSDDRNDASLDTIKNNGETK